MWWVCEPTGLSGTAVSPHAGMSRQGACAARGREGGPQACARAKTAFVGQGDWQWVPKTLTIRLHGCSSLHQVVSKLHGICRAERELPGQPNDQDAHQRVLQDGHLRAEAKEEAVGREGGAGLTGPPLAQMGLLGGAEAKGGDCHLLCAGNVPAASLPCTGQRAAPTLTHGHPLLWPLRRGSAIPKRNARRCSMLGSSGSGADRPVTTHHPPNSGM